MVTVKIMLRNGQEFSVIREERWLEELEQLRSQDIPARQVIQQMLADVLPRGAETVLVAVPGYGLLIALR
jgi:hypothetical protein